MRKPSWTGGKPPLSIKYIRDRSRITMATGWAISKVRYHIPPMFVFEGKHVFIRRRRCILTGIEGKADHLKDIGVNCIWLSSIFKSPMADFGYDISDFNQIDSTFGTMDDFISLQKKLKSLGNISILYNKSRILSYYAFRDLSNQFNYC